MNGSRYEEIEKYGDRVKWKANQKRLLRKEEKIKQTGMPIKELYLKENFPACAQFY